MCKRDKRGKLYEPMRYTRHRKGGEGKASRRTKMSLRRSTVSSDQRTFR